MMTAGEVWRTVLAEVASLAVASAAYVITIGMSIFVWMLLFHRWLDYDYVTVSSVLLVVSAASALLQGVGLSIRAKFERGALLFVATALLLLPLAFSAGLAVYEQVFQVDRTGSEALDLVALYRDALGVPLRAAIGLAVEFAPALTGTIAAIERSPLLVNLVSAVLIALAANTFGPARAAARA